MNLDYIQNHWTKSTPEDVASSIRAWDSVAEDYEKDKVVTFENPFLSMMAQKIPFTREMRTLDVGCGTGNYSLAIAPKVGHVVATDFSPKMLEGGARLARSHGIENITFLERDWFRCDGKEFEGQFDLAFAHTTPAVSDYPTLVKLMKATRRYGMLCIPTRRTDKVQGALQQFLGLPETRFDDAAAYTFDTLWGHGCNPEVTYTRTCWKSEKPLVKCYDWYLGKLANRNKLTDGQIQEAKKYLEHISIDGMVYDETNTTLANFFWEV